MTVQSYKNLLCTIMLLVSVALQPIFAQKNPYSLVQQEKNNAAHKLLAEGLETKDSLKISDAYYTLGRMDMDARNILQSTEWLFKGIKIRERFGNSDKLGRFYLRLHDNELEQGHIEKSLFYTRKAMQIFVDAKSQQGLAIAYSGMGNTFSMEYQLETIEKNKILHYDSAIHYFRKTEFHFQKLKDTLGLADNYTGLGHLALFKKDPKSIEFLIKATNLYQLLDKKSITLYSLLNLANAYLTFNQPKKAFAYIKKAENFKLKEKIKDYLSEAKFSSVYEKYYKAMGNWKDAFKYAEITHKLEKTRLMTDNEGAVSRLNIEYETQKKEIQLNKQKNELELNAKNILIQNRFLFTLSILLCLMVLLSIVFYRLYRKNQQISLQNTILVKEQNHRVKNNLQVVSSLLSLQSNRLSDAAAKQAVEESMLRVETMAILHRKLYDGEDLAIVNLSDFIMELVEGVLQTFGIESIDLNYSINNIKLPADQALSIGLIVNELVTNACKYAFRQHPKPSLSIACIPDNDELMLTVSDNGLNPKMYHKINTSSEIQKTFGMRLIQMQIAQLYGTFDFISGSGTTFTMRFKPLNNFSRK